MNYLVIRYVTYVINYFKSISIIYPWRVIWEKANSFCCYAQILYRADKFFHIFPWNLGIHLLAFLWVYLCVNLSFRNKSGLFTHCLFFLKLLYLRPHVVHQRLLLLQIYSAVCRVATLLQTRYTTPGFWLAGLRLFEEAEHLVTESSEQQHLKKCIARAREHLHEMETEVPASSGRQTGNALV